METNRTPPKRHQSHHVQLISALILVIVGSALLIGGFIVPPMGEIDSSVLIAFGEVMTFVGALFGIDYHYRCPPPPKGGSL